MVLNNFQYTRSSKALQWFCLAMLAARLCQMQGIAEEVLHITRHCSQVFFC